MAIVNFKKVQIIGHQPIRQDVVDLLQEQGLVEVTNLTGKLASLEYRDLVRKEEVEKDEALDVALERIDYAIRYLSSFEKKGFLESIVSLKPTFSQEEFLRLARDFDYTRVWEDCLAIDRRMKEIHALIGRLEAERDSLLPWTGLDAPLEEVRSTGKTDFTLGTISNVEFSKMAEDLLKEVIPYHVEIVSEGRVNKHIFLAYLLEDKERVFPIMKAHNFAYPFSPHLRGKPRDLVEGSAKRLNELRKERAELLSRIKGLLPEKVRLMVLYDFLLTRKGRQDIQDYFLRTKSAFLIEGWVKGEDVRKLERLLYKRWKELLVIIKDPEPSEAPPVVLENRGPFKPFELITDLYGMPYYARVDPTPFLAPFFFCFFGICLTDAGYGLVLMGLSWFILKKLGVARRLFKVLGFGGLATVLFGAISGGWFGTEIETLPWPFSMVRSLKVLDPLNQPMVFFAMALSFGFLHVWSGYLIQMVKDLRERRFIDGLFGDLPWLLITPGFYGILLSLIFGEDAIPPGITRICLWTMFLAFLGRSVFLAIFKRRLLAILAASLVNFLNGIKNLLGNILSYSRLMALGLATTVIAITVNIVSKMALDIPVVGYLAMGFVLVGGHLFNLAINALSGFVHTCRLQYVEFFPYFFEGGGKVFSPFKKENKYTVIKSSE